MRYIDADKLITALCDCTEDTWGKGLGASWWAQSVKLKDNMVECINNQPRADVAEVKHGYWKDIYVKNGYGDIIEKQIECSECKEFFKVEIHANEYWKSRFKNCPFCGAVMDGKE